MRGRSEHHETSPLHNGGVAETGFYGVDGKPSRGEPVGDGVRHFGGVAEHRFIDDERLGPL